MRFQPRDILKRHRHLPDCHSALLATETCKMGRKSHRSRSHNQQLLCKPGCREGYFYTMPYIVRVSLPRFWCLARTVCYLPVFSAVMTAASRIIRFRCACPTHVPLRAFFHFPLYKHSRKVTNRQGHMTSVWGRQRTSTAKTRTCQL